MDMPRTNKRFIATLLANYGTFIKFGFVGGTTAIIYFFLMWISNSVLGLHYLIAVSIAYFFSTAYHFLANKHFTFRAGNAEYKKQFARYAVVWILNYFISVSVIRFIVEYLLLSPYIGVCFSILITMPVGFFLSRHWVYKIRSA